MELGSWSLITAPSLLALIPLIVMIVLVFRGKSNVSGMMVGIILGALMMGQDLGALAKAFSASLGSTTALIGRHHYDGSGTGRADDRDRRDPHPGVLDREAHRRQYSDKGKAGIGDLFHPDLRPAGYFGRRKRGHCPHYAADPGFAGRHAYRGGHTV